MKVTGISLDNRRTTAVSGEKFPDFILILFKTPVFLRSGISEKLLCRNCGVIFSGNHPIYIRSADKSNIVTDYIRFRPSPSDMQYIDSLGIPIGKPFQLGETIVAGSIFNVIGLQEFPTEAMKNDFLEASVRMLLINIATQLCTDSSAVKNIPHYLRLKALRKSIYEFPAERRSIDDICSELNISKTYFHRIYSSAFGVTCMQDIINSRITHAQNLLKDTSLSVTFIAEQCGYDSDSYFMRQFKQQTGCTPTEYRRLCSNL